MTSKERIIKIFNHKGDGTNAFWTGAPRIDTLEKYIKQAGVNSQEQLYTMLGDDIRHIHAEYGYTKWGQRPFFITTVGNKNSLSQDGIFAEAECVNDVRSSDYPSVNDMDFAKIKQQFIKGDIFEEGAFGNKQIADKAVFSGMWCEFFHIVSDYFGMENYFCKMYTNPDVVHYVTNRVVEFFEQVNNKFFAECGQYVDVMFMGNDFGTQRGLLISPELFDEFILPYYKRLVNVAKKYDKKVIVHSCGSIYEIIPRLIDIGIDAIHPLQAKAEMMSAEKLANEFKRDLVFMGGIDSQDLLIHATPKQIKDEVFKLREVFGANYIVSSSHETILPNVPLENIMAMAEAAKE